MTPTPEDIALAAQIEERAWCPAHLDNVETARLIAAHTAPLRELAEIGRLAVERETAFRSGQDIDALDRLEGDAEKAVRAYLAKHPTEKS